MIHYIFALSITICYSGINSHATQTPSKDILVVSFISIGTGTDYKAEDRLALFVKDFEAKNKITVTVSTKNWGREGERDYRYDLKLLSKKQCKDFVDSIKEMFRENNLVKIKYGDAE